MDLKAKALYKSKTKYKTKSYKIILTKLTQITI